MQFPLVQGPHIGKPNMYQGTSSGARGNGFTGSLTPMPNRTVRNTLGFMSNYSINYAYVTRRMRNLSDQSLNIGQYVFIRKFKHPLGNTKLYSMVNIVQLNQILASECGRSQFNTAADILDQWTPLGIVVGEVGYDVKSENGSQQPQERLINCTIAGRASCFNIWGKYAVQDGCPLYFKLEKVRRNNLKPFQYKLNNPREEEPTIRCDDCWQFKAYANWKIPRHLIEKKKDEYYIYVGRISSSGFSETCGSDDHTERAHTSIDKMVTLPQIEIFCDYDSSPPSVELST